MDLLLSVIATSHRRIDPDALDYIGRVEAADGEALEDGVRTAIINLIVGLKAAPAPVAATCWDAIGVGSACLLAGPRTIAGTLVPLKASMPTPVNFHFLAGDYDRETGLKGDGSTKYIDTQRVLTGDLLNDQHQAVWVTSAGSNLSKGLLGSGTGQNGATHLLSNGAARCRTSVAIFASLGVSQACFGISRHQAASAVIRSGGVSDTRANASVQLPTGSTHVFSRGGADVSTSGADARLAYYSEGRAIDLAALDSLLTSYLAAVSAAIP